MGLDFEFGRIRLPRAMDDPKSKGKSLFLIPRGPGLPVRRTNDVLMALWFLKANLRQIGYSPPRERVVTNWQRLSHTAGVRW
jgi:hypothetical protein